MIDLMTAERSMRQLAGLFLHPDIPPPISPLANTTWTKGGQVAVSVAGDPLH